MIFLSAYIQQTVKLLVLFQQLAPKHTKTHYYAILACYTQKFLKRGIYKRFLYFRESISNQIVILLEC